MKAQPAQLIEGLEVVFFYWEKMPFRWYFVMGLVVVGKNACGKKWMFITCFVRFSMFLFGLKYVSFASEDQDHQGIPLHETTYLVHVLR